MLALLVEDNRDLAENILDYLELEDIECDYTDHGNHALQLIQDNNYDVIILDIQLPGSDGYSICTKARALGISTPILMLTAKDTLADKLTGFKAGTDDYLVKPFELEELTMRLLALNKRSMGSTSHSQELSIADLRLNLANQSVYRDKTAINLPPACWKILLELVRQSPSIVSREKLEKILWPDQSPDSEALKSHLYSLRKLIDKPYDKQLIHTKRGLGVFISDQETT